MEIYGLMYRGRRTGEFGKAVLIQPEPALHYWLIQLVLSFVSVIVSAKIIQMIGKSFHGRQTYQQAFTVVAYSLSPMFTLRVFNALPQVPVWLTWGIGILLSVSLIYQGIPRVMQPDVTHSLGLYLLSAIMLVVITGLARLLTYIILNEQIHSGVASALKSFPAVG